MDNVYQAEVVALGEDIEEEVVLSIQGIRLTCFAGVCPYKIKKGKTYPVSLGLMVFGDYDIEAVEETTPGLTRRGRGFAYELRGWLRGDALDAGIVFRDDVFLSQCGYLDGRFVSMKVDRIDAEFLQPDSSGGAGDQ